MRETAWLGTPLLACSETHVLLCFSVLLWQAGAPVSPAAVRQQCYRGPGKAGLDGGGQWRPGARAGPADQASSGSLCLTVGSTPRKEGLPNLFQPQHGLAPPFSCLPSSLSWEGCGEKRPQGSGKMWAEELGVLWGVSLNCCTPSPAPAPASCPSPCQAARTCPSPSLSLSAPDLDARFQHFQPAGHSPRALGAERAPRVCHAHLPENSCRVRRSHSHSHSHGGLTRLQSCLRVNPGQTDTHAHPPTLTHTPSHTHTLTQGQQGAQSWKNLEAGPWRVTNAESCPHDREPLGTGNHRRLWNHNRSR